MLGPQDTLTVTGSGAVCTDDKPAYEYKRESVSYLDVTRKLHERHNEKQFSMLVELQPNVEQLLVDSGESPERQEYWGGTGARRNGKN